MIMWEIFLFGPLKHCACIFNTNAYIPIFSLRTSSLPNFSGAILHESSMSNHHQDQGVSSLIQDNSRDIEHILSSCTSNIKPPPNYPEPEKYDKSISNVR